MADGRKRQGWVYTSHLLAMLNNCHRDPKSTAAQPGDFNPYVRQEPVDDDAAVDFSPIEVLKVFLPKA